MDVPSARRPETRRWGDPYRARAGAAGGSSSRSAPCRHLDVAEQAEGVSDPLYPLREPAARALTHMAVSLSRRPRPNARRLGRGTCLAGLPQRERIGYLVEVHDPAITLSSGTVIALPPSMSAAEFPVSAVVKVTTMEQDVRTGGEQIYRVHG